MALKEKRHYNFSPHKKSKFMDSMERLMDEMDFMDSQREAKFQNVANEMKSTMNGYGKELKNLMKRLDKTEEVLVLNRTELDDHAALNKSLVENVRQLQEIHLKNMASTNKELERLQTNSQKLAQFQLNYEQRLSKLEEKAASPRSHQSPPADSSGVERPKRRCCSFCGKELMSTYVRKHQKKYCKKAAAAAAAALEEENAHESPPVISDGQSLSGTEDEALEPHGVISDVRSLSEAAGIEVIFDVRTLDGTPIFLQ